MSSLSRTIALMAAALLGVVTVTQAVAQVPFAAVSAGDMTGTDVILWTQFQNGSATALTVDIATDGAFQNVVQRVNGTTVPANDYTAKMRATGLVPNTQYFYRFSAGATTSDVGRFYTNPAPGQAVPFKVGFTGDYDAPYRPYSVLAGFGRNPPSAGLNAFINLGDLLYERNAIGSPMLPPLTPLSSAASVQAAMPHYYRKYLEGISGVTAAGAMTAVGQQGMKELLSTIGVYTLIDNHELNGAMISGGAPLTSEKENTNPDVAVNRTGSYINQSVAFKMMEKTFFDTHATAVQINGLPTTGMTITNLQLPNPTVVSPSNPRSDGTAENYFARIWGRAATYIQLDDRSYRDARMVDTSSATANNPERVMVGEPQLQWFKQQLLAAEASGVVWKVVAISSPIDQWDATDNKSWLAGYNAERNQIMGFIAANRIRNVVFLTTDDHFARTTRLQYQPDMANQPNLWAAVPGAFQVLAGPAGAGGPFDNANNDFSYARSQTLTAEANARLAQSGRPPVGLVGFQGLANVFRAGNPNAMSNPASADFSAPTTYNYATLGWDRFANMTVEFWGIDAYEANTYPASSPSPTLIMSFQVHVPYTIEVGDTVNLSDVDFPYFNSTWTTKGTLDISATTNGASLASLAGNGIVNLGNQTLTLRDAADTFSGSINGTGGLALMGGVLNLVGSNTYTGPTTVSNAALWVNGSTASSRLTTVNAGGTLGGTGTVGTTQINSGGTLSPGNSIGTITVNGNLAFGAGSTYAVEVSPNAADRTNVTGTAALAGTLQSSFPPGTYYARNYTLLSATGGRTGTFGTFSTAGLPGGFQSSLSYTSTDVVLNLTAALGGGTALSGNQGNVANALNTSFNSGNSLSSGLYGLFSMSGPPLASALNSLSGEGIAGAQTASYAAVSEFATAVRGQGMDWVMGPMGNPGKAGSPQKPGPQWRSWAAAMGSNGHIDGVGSVGSATVSARGGGGLAGLEVRINENFVVGIAAGGFTSSYTVSERATSGKQTGGIGAVYGVARFDRLYAMGLVSYGDFGTKSTRYVAGPVGVETATGSFSSNAWTGRMELGYRFENPLANVSPYVAIQGTSLGNSGFTETTTTAAGAAGAMGLAVQGRGGSSVPGALGVQFDRRFSIDDDWAIRPVLRLAWVHEFSGTRAVTAGLAAIPASAWTVQGASAATDAADINLSVQVLHRNGLALTASAAAYAAPRATGMQGQLRVSYQW